MLTPVSGASPEYTAAQCAQTGVTAAQYGSVVQSPADQYNQVTGGNVDLDVEEADTITVGVVLTPTDNLTVSLDYWNIEIENTIATVGAENIVSDSVPPTASCVIQLLEAPLVTCGRAKSLACSMVCKTLVRA